MENLTSPNLGDSTFIERTELPLAAVVVKTVIKVILQ